MNTALPLETNGSPPIRWSLYAGVYMFICAVVTAFALADMLLLLADVIGLPTAYSGVIFASPAFVIGTVAWWTIVEGRGSYTYLRGGAVGVVTASLTGLVWTVRFVRFWGFEMLAVPIISALVALVLGVTITVGALVGFPLMYARRRSLRGLPGENQRIA